MPVTRILPTVPTYRRIMKAVDRVERLPFNSISDPVARPMRSGEDNNVFLVKITGLHDDSPTSGVRMYKGDVYEDGSEEDATKEDVTIRVAGVEADVLLPTTVFCLAVMLTETWEGDSETHTNDLVYEVALPDIPDTVLLKIIGLHTDSPASGVRMYAGQLYMNGSAAAATSGSITVRIPSIGANVTSPSSGYWSDVPFCTAVKTTATWVGATQTHTDDTVYEAVGLLLVV